jgi:hypothetical protein
MNQPVTFQVNGTFTHQPPALLAVILSTLQYRFQVEEALRGG